MGEFIRKANKYTEIFRLLEGDPTLRVKTMLKKYATSWDLDKQLVKDILSDANSTAEDIIDTLKVFSADFASNIELRQGVSAMDSGTQRIRREHLISIEDKHESHLDYADISHIHHHRYRAA